MNNKFVKGQTLIEVIVALSVVLLILAAIAVAVTTSVSNSTYLKSHNLASKHAQDGMEYIRHLYENQENFFESYPEGAEYFMGEDNTIQQGFFEVNIDEQFVRKVNFQEGVNCNTDVVLDNSEVRVTVSVFWSSGKCKGSSTEERYCHKSELVTCFTQRNRGFTL